jgi:hypothetical protein
MCHGKDPEEAIAAIVDTLHSRDAIRERWLWPSSLLGRTTEGEDGHVLELVEWAGTLWGPWTLGVRARAQQEGKPALVQTDTLLRFLALFNVQNRAFLGERGGRAECGAGRACDDALLLHTW